MAYKELSLDEYLKIYKNLISLRLTEETIASEYPHGEMRTPTHLGIGQEAIALGVLAEKIEGDAVFSHHRCHNHYLASGGSRVKLFAELLGRKSGCSGGKGGSVHLVDRDNGFFGSSAILGQSIALATGAAFGFKYSMSGNISIAFFGDAALEEGTFWEAANFATIHNLPVLFVCENNSYSTESHISKRIAPESNFANRVKSFGVSYVSGNGNSYPDVNMKASEAITRMRTNPHPVFLEFETYRWREHVGPLFDHEANRNYRSINELNYWKANCPIDQLKRLIEIQYPKSSERLEEIYSASLKEIKEEFELAQNEPWPDILDIYSNVFWGERQQ